MDSERDAISMSSSRRSWGLCTRFHMNFSIIKNGPLTLTTNNHRLAMFESVFYRLILFGNSFLKGPCCFMGKPAFSKLLYGTLKNYFGPVLPWNPPRKGGNCIMFFPSKLPGPFTRNKGLINNDSHPNS